MLKQDKKDKPSLPVLQMKSFLFMLRCKHSYNGAPPQKLGWPQLESDSKQKWNRVYYFCFQEGEKNQQKLKANKKNAPRENL